MRRLVLADCHIGQRPGDAGEMTGWLRSAAAAGCAEVIYLGDAFQYLIGMSKFWNSGIREVIGTWRELRRAGMRIMIVEGNRDFFLDAPELSREVDGVGRRLDLVAGAARYRLDHGDLVNRRDLQYLFWSRLSKSSVARLSARLLPRRLAVAIVERTEARLALTNRRFRYVKPLRDLGRSAEDAWREGVDVVLWGHFHTPWWYSRDRRLALVVPAWLEHRVGVLIEPDGRAFWVEKNLTPLVALDRLTACGVFPVALETSIDR